MSKYDFAYVLQFFSLISDGLGRVNGLKLNPGLSNIIDDMYLRALPCKDVARIK